MEASLKVLKELLQKLATENKYENFKISTKQISSGGANYTGYLYLNTISSPGKEDMKIFAKLAAMSEDMRQHGQNIYNIEIYFYTVLLKMYRDLEEEHRVAEPYKLRTAKFYGSSQEYLNEVLLLEDLVASGYQPFDRFACITWEQVKESIGQLAKLHALSLCLSKTYPEKYEKTRHSILTMNEGSTSMYKTLLQNMLQKVLEGTEDKDKKRIKEFVDKILNNDKFNSIAIKPIKKSVIIHGDYRPSNLMHKTNNGACQVLLLDFQTLRYGSPVYDLLYFIDLSFDNELREKYYQATLDFYVSELHAALRRLKIEPNYVYSRKDFEYEYKEILPYNVLMGLCGLLIITVDEDSAPKVIQNIDIKDFAVDPNELYKKKIKEFIDFYTKMGVF